MLCVQNRRSLSLYIWEEVIYLKKRSIVLSILLALILASTAYAQEIRMNYGYADISISGTTANCHAVIPGNNDKDKISATIELRCGSETIKTWNEHSDCGYLEFRDTVSVTKGKTYELVVEYTVNGKSQQSFSDSDTCN